MAHGWIQDILVDSDIYIAWIKIKIQMIDKEK